ncbi:MAG: 23S rRNA (adenine(2503)-C(2))-methyltransferase RlmN [bacterium]|nr:23S rRNA (adenine(2503)-C(2))-methyltransferase RlmN [bacterium]
MNIEQSMDKIDLRGITCLQLQHLLAEGGFSPFQARELFHLLYGKYTDNPISKALRSFLEKRFYLSRITLKDYLKSTEGTEKFLFSLTDGQHIETVSIPKAHNMGRESHNMGREPHNMGREPHNSESATHHKYLPPKRLTLCLSTQVGCKFACTFCTSGRGGFVRNLEAAEIINQVMALQPGMKRELNLPGSPLYGMDSPSQGKGAHENNCPGKTFAPLKGDRPIALHGMDSRAQGSFSPPPAVDIRTTAPVSNIVFMGIGEPLDNYDNVIQAVNILRDAQGLYVAKRKISISTCGLVPEIHRLYKEKQGIRLSISLHSVDDNLRSAMMPINKKYPLRELRKAVEAFTEAEGFPVFFEYILIKDLNISSKDAQALASFVKPLNCKVNLIPYNPSQGFAGKRPTEEEITEFCNRLEDLDVFYTLRQSRGRDIAAACGQLKTNHKP